MRNMLLCCWPTIRLNCTSSTAEEEEGPDDEGADELPESWSKRVKGREDESKKQIIKIRKVSMVYKINRARKMFSIEESTRVVIEILMWGWVSESLNR